MPTAVVIDGSYFIRRFSYSFPGLSAASASHIATGVCELAAWHVRVRLNAERGFGPGEMVTYRAEETSQLYRIFFYDGPPLVKRLHQPVSKRSLDLSKTEQAILRLELHERLHRTRKVAVRLGRLSENFSDWRPKPDAVKRWLASAPNFAPADDDFTIDTRQKGVDMRLGLDVASMAFKRQVDQIIMVTADADFVPAAKLARREGIDVVLDPMGGIAAPDLLQHVDGIRTCVMPELGRSPNE